MIRYCYSDLEGGPVQEHYCPMGQAPKSLTVDGRTLYRDIAAEHCGQRSGDPWENHWSLSMGARTDEHAVEIAEKLAAAKLPCEFDRHLRLRVHSAVEQCKMADAIFGKGKVRNLDSYY